MNDRGFPFKQRKGKSLNSVNRLSLPLMNVCNNFPRTQLKGILHKNKKLIKLSIEIEFKFIKTHYLLNTHECEEKEIDNEIL